VLLDRRAQRRVVVLGRLQPAVRLRDQLRRRDFALAVERGLLSQQEGAEPGLLFARAVVHALVDLQPQQVAEDRAPVRRRALQEALELACGRITDCVKAS
jgi:hypothetical protein